MNATREELISVPDVGDIVADSIVSFFEDEVNKTSVKRLLEFGVRPQPIEKPKPVSTDSFFYGKTVVLTGTLHLMTREEATAKLEACGAKVTGSVSRRRISSSPARRPAASSPKAEQLGISVITDENELVRLLQEAMPAE